MVRAHEREREIERDRELRGDRQGLDVRKRSRFSMVYSRLKSLVPWDVVNHGVLVKK